MCLKLGSRNFKRKAGLQEPRNVDSTENFERHMLEASRREHKTIYFLGIERKIFIAGLLSRAFCPHCIFRSTETVEETPRPTCVPGVQDC